MHDQSRAAFYTCNIPVYIYIYICFLHLLLSALTIARETLTHSVQPVGSAACSLCVLDFEIRRYNESRDTEYTRIYCSLYRDY